MHKTKTQPIRIYPSWRDIYERNDFKEGIVEEIGMTEVSIDKNQLERLIEGSLVLTTADIVCRKRMLMGYPCSSEEMEESWKNIAKNEKPSNGKYVLPVMVYSVSTILASCHPF